MGAGREGSVAPRAGVYFPGVNGRGGAGRLAVLLALEIARGGWDTAVFTDGSVAPGELARDLGVDVSPLRFVSLPGEAPGAGRLRELRRLGTTWRHARRIRRLRLDLFVNAKFRSSLPGCGRRNVYYCHFPQRLQVSGSGAARRSYLWAMSVLERRLVARDRQGFLGTYDEVWANSRYTAGHIERRWHRHAEVVHPPCEQIAPAEKGSVIAVVGRFQAPGPNAPYKAQDVLLRTFATMTDLHRAGWRLVMAGGTTPADRDYVAGLRAAAGGLPVSILADGSRQDIRDLLGGASLYWHAQGYGQDAERFPETQEHFGISTVEAMSAGAIPVVFGSAGPAEVVEGVEGVVSWQHPSQLAALTRAWAARSPDEVDAVRLRCRERAEQFDELHFRRRVEALG